MGLITAVTYLTVAHTLPAVFCLRLLHRKQHWLDSTLQVTRRPQDQSTTHTLPTLSLMAAAGKHVDLLMAHACLPSPCQARQMAYCRGA